VGQVMGLSDCNKKCMKHVKFMPLDSVEVCTGSALGPTQTVEWAWS
jgi:hypothetical protein